MSLRIGHGIDAHRFGGDGVLMLGCVEVPGAVRLAGHSDGDAAAHALADALLGAAHLGTIGEHFPSGDERWRDVSGHDLLARVATLLADAGSAVISAQVVIVAETPRLAAHLAGMGRALAAALGVEAGTVSVSATTTDGMGMTGAGEGIACSAVALVDGGA